MRSNLATKVVKPQSWHWSSAQVPTTIRRHTSCALVEDSLPAPRWPTELWRTERRQSKRPTNFQTSEESHSGKRPIARQTMLRVAFRRFVFQHGKSERMPVSKKKCSASRLQETNG